MLETANRRGSIPVGISFECYSLLCLLIFYRLRSLRKVHFLFTILKALCKIFTGAGNFVTEIFVFCNFLTFFDCLFFCW